MRIQVIIIAVVTAITLCWMPVLQAASVEQQRDWFQQARAALNKHQIKQFHTLKDKLDDYPLTPYLDIWHARKALNKGDDSMVATTLRAYADVPETIDLRRSWLKYLAKKGRWEAVRGVIDQFPNLVSRLPDIAMLSAWHAGHSEDAMQGFSKRWQQGKKISPMFKPLYRAWLKQGHPTDIERWQRIAVLVKQGHWKQTRVIARPLSTQQKSWLSYWRGMQRDPEKALQAWPKSLSTAAASVPTALIINDAIKRLSRRDIDQAWHHLKRLQSTQKQIDADVFFALEQFIALRAAKQHKPEAMAWLAQLPASLQTKDTRGWQVRLALLAHNWISVLSVIEAMPPEQRQQDRWMYWHAQALDAVGDVESAQHELATLAVGRGYYNFLSAEQLALPLRIEASEILVSDAMIAAVKNMPAIIRAHEWLQVGKRSKASREWHFALAGADQATWKAAAVLATRWYWHDQVIRAAFKAGEMDALSNRFPMSYKTIVLQAANETGLKPAEIWSIIRQESAFNQHAVSYVGAKGLMQLMPATARQVARQLNMPKGTPKLFSAATNIRLGTTYLADIKQRFGNLALAAAGYNAGPHRVSTWLERVSFDSPQAWVEAIPFNETRRYVQQVMAFVSVYEWRQHKPLSSLLARLHGDTQKVSLKQPVVVYDVQLK